MANPAFNLFDVLLVVVLIGGIVHGRKHGASLELLSMMKWVALVLVGGAISRPGGPLVAQTGVFDVLTSYLFVYLGSALVIFLFFSILERRLVPKLTGSDIFG